MNIVMVAISTTFVSSKPLFSHWQVKEKRQIRVINCKSKICQDAMEFAGK